MGHALLCAANVKHSLPPGRQATSLGRALARSIASTYISSMLRRFGATRRHARITSVACGALSLVVASCVLTSDFEGLVGVDDSGSASVESSVNPPPTSCPIERADCNGFAGDGCEITLDSDRKHCGRCGHDCLAGACDRGTCRPFAVTDGQDVVSAVYADDSSVYWITGDAAKVPQDIGRAGRLMKAPADGSRGDVQFATTYDGTGYSKDLLVGDSAQVFLAQRQYDHHHIFAFDKSGGGQANNILYRKGVAISPEFYQRQVVLDSSSIVYAGPVEIGMTSKVGSSVGFRLFAGSGEITRSIAVDDKFLFVLTSSTGDIVKIRKDIAQDAGAETPWASGQLGGTALTTRAGEEFVYWVVPSVSEIRKLPRSGSGGEPTVFADPDASPSELALDQVAVYWIAASAGEVSALAKDGRGGTRVLASAQSNPRFLSIANRAIYWSVRNTAIYGVAKP